MEKYNEIATYNYNKKRKAIINGMVVFYDCVCINERSIFIGRKKNKTDYQSVIYVTEKQKKKIELFYKEKSINSIVINIETVPESYLFHIFDIVHEEQIDDDNIKLTLILQTPDK